MDFLRAEEHLLRQRRFGVKLGLHNMVEAMTALAHPERSFISLLVAGSKGKGSVCAFLESILLAAGHSPGMYTSPHLVHVRERIRLGGDPISEERFAGLVTELAGIFRRRKLKLTYFEWLTAMAIRHFSERKVRVALFEVGLGGRLDATNIVPARLSLVTEIEKEHAEYLGTTLGEIAREKSGIIKEGAALISGVTSPTARKEISRTARQREVTPRWLDREATWEVAGQTLKGVKMDLVTPRGVYRNLRLGILGRHQARNASLAVLAAEELGKWGLHIGKGHVRSGLAAARWPGRCEFRRGSPPLFLDGAHTPASSRALVDALNELFPRRQRVFLFGALRDKNIPLLASILFPGAREVVCVAPPDERGVLPGEMVRALPGRWRRICRGVEDITRGLAAARKSAGPKGVVVVAGSFYLVGAVLRLLSGEKGAGTGRI